MDEVELDTIESEPDVRDPLPIEVDDVTVLSATETFKGIIEKIIVVVVDKIREALGLWPTNLKNIGAVRALCTDIRDHLHIRARVRDNLRKRHVTDPLPEEASEEKKHEEQHVHKKSRRPE